MASPKRNKDGQVQLYGYQRRWVQDDARFKLGVWARQTGKDFSTTLSHVRRRIAKRGDTIWVAASERQSIQAIEYVKRHNDALETKFEYEEIEFPKADEKARVVIYPINGSRILAMPANPDTIRGFSGDVVLNEFAFMRDALKIWRAAFAIASRGFTVEVTSTPNGQQGKFFELCRQAGVPMMGGAEKTQWQREGWSVHWVDIYNAIAEGCPINAAELRQAIDDEDTWLQEEELVFLADAENYIPMELIVAAESEGATLDAPEFTQGELYLGVDIGRRKDRTVLWLNEKIGDVLWTRRVDVLSRQPFQAQFKLIDSFMPNVRRACIDATGLGMQLAEDLQAKWGARVEPVEFNVANKEAMATGTKRSFEDRTLRIPGAAFIRRSLNAVKRYTSPTGHFRFDAERTDKGHADEFWALALSINAAAGSVPAFIAAVNPQSDWLRANSSRGEISKSVADLQLAGTGERLTPRLGLRDGGTL